MPRRLVYRDLIQFFQPLLRKLVTLDTARCSDRNTFKDLSFPFTRQHKRWNDANLRIAIVNASAGKLL